MAEALPLYRAGSPFTGGAGGNRWSKSGVFIYEPPQSDRKVKSVEGHAPSRRVDQTINHISKGWFPINGEILKAVQEKLNDGAYSDVSGRRFRRLAATCSDDPATC